MIAANKTNLSNSLHWLPQLTITHNFYREQESHGNWEMGPVLFILTCQGLSPSWCMSHTYIMSFLNSILGNYTWCGEKEYLSKIQKVWIWAVDFIFNHYFPFAFLGSTSYDCDWILPIPVPNLSSLLYRMTRRTCCPDHLGKLVELTLN